MSSFRIARIGHLGDGITQEGLIAPLTLPGEEVSGTVRGEGLSEIRVLVPSPDRVAPPCQHFRSCGGCQLQHASDRVVTSWKEDVVRRALGAHGIVAEIETLHISPPRSRRRVTLAARRTKKGAMAGFHARGSDSIVDVTDCFLMHPDLLRAVPLARDLAMAGASRKSTLSVSVTQSMAGLDVLVSGGKPLDGPLRFELASLAAGQDLARLAWEGEIVVTRRQPEQAFAKARIVPPPGAFLQATPDGEAALVAQTETILAASTRIVDLFSGCGTFALPLAQKAHVHAVEGDASMIAALDAGWRRAEGLKTLTSEARDLFRRPLLAAELGGFDGAVIDPPRAGARAQIAEIARSRLPRLAYVSCNPATFARDVRLLLSEGFVMGPVRVIDQFRWSVHVELVVGFERRFEAIEKK